MKLILSTAAAAAAMIVAASPASAQAYSYGSGALLFTLDSLPTGPSGTQAFYGPNQDYTAIGLGTLPGLQYDTNGNYVLQQTVGGTTINFHTPDYVYGAPNSINTSIRVENDSQNFNYLGVPAGVQVGIQAGGGPTPSAPVIVNSSSALDYFSINFYRLSSGAGPGSPISTSTTVTAYSGLNGTGAVLGSTSYTISGGLNFAYETLALSNLGGAQSFTLQGTSALAGNYDDITATVFTPSATGAVPEPASWAMMIGGFGLAGYALRRRVRRTAASFA